jgi:hypothetical protein
MSGFVAENFFEQKPVLVKSRKVIAISKLFKIKYEFNYSIQLLNLINRWNCETSPYNNLIIREASIDMWRLYNNLVPSNLGLQVSNMHKSILRKTVMQLSASGKFTKIDYSPAYLRNFESYHFNTSNQVYKKLLFTCISSIALNYQPYKLAVNIPNGYLWIGWFFRLNPLNNSFYLKIYNY